MTKIYLVQIHAVDPEQKDKIDILDETDTDKTVHFFYSYPKETRTRIRSIQGKYIRQMNNSMFNFYGIRLISEDTIPCIENLSKQLFGELSNVVPNLHGSISLTPIVLDSNNSDLSRLINNEVKKHIYSEIKDKLTKYINKPLSNKGNEAIRRAIDVMQTKNILSSEEANSILNDLRMRINPDIQIQSIVEEVEKQLEILKTDFALVEI